MGAASSLMGQPVQHTAAEQNPRVPTLQRQHRDPGIPEGAQAPGQTAELEITHPHTHRPRPAWLAGAHEQALTTQFPFSEEVDQYFTP